MLTKEVSQTYFKNALTSIHAARANILFETCWSLANQADLTIASLGRNMDGNAYVKHKIKSVDRLIGNSKLHSEISTIYKEFFKPYITCVPKLYIIVDWSGCCRDDIHMIRASIVANGRSISFYNEVHPQEVLGNREIQGRFLKNLYNQIPFGKEVVIITDAGFVTPWFKAVLKLGWHYVGRLKSDVKILIKDRPRWMRVKNLHRTANAKIKYVGNGVIGSSSSTPVNGDIYSYKKKSSNRKGKSRYPDVNKRHSKANKSPWILATSLKNAEFGKKFIKDLYEKRMQIEQNFRDEKSAKFGFGFEYSKSNCLERIAAICLIANIAAYLLLMLGNLAEKIGLHKRYQVNTAKKRVLSFITLAKQILKNGPPRELSQEYEKATRLLVTNSEILCGY